MFLAYISVFTLLVPTGISIRKYHHLSTSFKGLAWYLYASCCTELLADLLARGQQNNLPLLHLFTVIEFTLLVWCLGQLLSTSKYFILFLQLIFILFASINALYFQDIWHFNTNARGLECLLLIIFSLKYYHQLFVALKVTQLEKDPGFWLSTSILIYFSANLFIFIFSNVILLDYIDFLGKIWWIHSSLNILFYLLLSISLLCNRTQ